MTQALERRVETRVKTPTIRTRPWSNEASTLECPRCKADLLHHTGVSVFDCGEDAASVTRTDVSAGVVKVDPRNDGWDNPSARRDGLAIQFWCEGCGEDASPIELTIAQHKGSTEIGWRYEPEAASD